MTKKGKNPESVGEDAPKVGTLPLVGGELFMKDQAATTAWLVGVLGLAFVLVGLVDLALLWFPLRFGNAPWEFGILSRTLANLPMTALGLGLITFGVLSHPNTRAWVARGLAGGFGLITLLTVVMGILYVTAVPAVIRQSSDDSLGALGKSIVKTSVEIAVYTLIFGALTVILWRAVEKRS